MCCYYDKKLTAKYRNGSTWVTGWKVMFRFNRDLVPVHGRGIYEEHNPRIRVDRDSYRPGSPRGYHVYLSRRAAKWLLDLYGAETPWRIVVRVRFRRRDIAFVGLDQMTGNGHMHAVVQTFDIPDYETIRNGGDA